MHGLIINVINITYEFLGPLQRTVIQLVFVSISIFFKKVFHIFG
jgi:hypothetical protein